MIETFLLSIMAFFHIIELTAALLVGYIFGCIPFGIIVSKAFHLPSPTDIGSGNIGATNVLRSGHKLAAFLTLLGDGLKAAVPIYCLSQIYTPSLASFNAIILLGACIGHAFPYFLNFQGGKAVATSLGGLLVISPYIGLISCFTWIITAYFTRYSSLSSLITILMIPLWMYIFGETYFLYEIMLIMLLIIYRHKDNIVRIIQGKEPKIGAK